MCLPVVKQNKVSSKNLGYQAMLVSKYFQILQRILVSPKRQEISIGPEYFSRCHQLATIYCKNLKYCTNKTSFEWIKYIKDQNMHFNFFRCNFILFYSPICFIHLYCHLRGGLFENKNIIIIKMCLNNTVLKIAF
jgi:hypothetical protein